MGPPPEPEKAAVYRAGPPPLWRVPDALARIRRLLGTLGAPDGVSLWRFLPDPGALAARATGPGQNVPDQAALCRSALASTLVAGLELARQGQLTLVQAQSFGTITVYAASTAMAADSAAADGAAGGEVQ